MKVSNFVDFIPFRTVNAQNPLMGDVSLNGSVQAYDASLLLQRVANQITFNTIQNYVADVSANAGISAFDASLVLQYIVGKIRNFPAEVLQKSGNVVIDKASGSIFLDNFKLKNNTEFILPVRLLNSKNIQSIELDLNFDQNYIEYLGQEASTFTDGYQTLHSISNGVLNLRFAGVNALADSGTIIYLKFKAKDNIVGDISTKIFISKFLANEDELTSYCNESTIQIEGNRVTNVDAQNISLNNIYPNPIKENLNIKFELKENSFVLVEVFDIYGKKVAELMNEANVNADVYHLIWKTKENGEQVYKNGHYIIKLSTANSVLTSKVIVE